MSSRTPKSDPSVCSCRCSASSRGRSVVRCRIAGARRSGRARSDPAPHDSDEAARLFAVDPRNNVVLEASAGTGKTSVLVASYVNLLKAGVEPANILAITFTRKAAAEMRERIVARAAGRRGALGVRQGALERAARSARRDRDQHDRRVLPVAAARVPARGGRGSRLRDGRRDRSAAAGRRVAGSVAADLHRAGAGRSRTSRWCWRSSGCRARAKGSRLLLDRRLVAWSALDRFLARGPADLTVRPPCAGAHADGAAGRAARRARRPGTVPRGRPDRSSALPAARCASSSGCQGSSSRRTPRSGR